MIENNSGFTGANTRLEFGRRKVVTRFRDTQIARTA